MQTPDGVDFRQSCRDLRPSRGIGTGTVSRRKVGHNSSEIGRYGLPSSCGVPVPHEQPPLSLLRRTFFVTERLGKQAEALGGIFLSLVLEVLGAARRRGARRVEYFKRGNLRLGRLKFWSSIRGFDPGPG